MKTGLTFSINRVEYRVDLSGPNTTLLIRGDGAFVHADTASLNYLLKAAK